MLFGKKDKKRGLPDLPSSGIGLPPNREEIEEVHELPSFPDSPIKKGFTQSAIKDAVTTEEREKEELPEFDNFKRKKRKIIEMDDWHPPQNSISPPIETEHRQKPVFIRLDKFNFARKSLNEISEKLEETSDILRKIRELKETEDAEMSSWEKDMENLKSRVSNIMSEIFEKSDY